jgi:O-methyltransferase
MRPLEQTRVDVVEATFQERKSHCAKGDVGRVDDHSRLLRQSVGEAAEKGQRIGDMLDDVCQDDEVVALCKRLDEVLGKPDVESPVVRSCKGRGITIGLDAIDGDVLMRFMQQARKQAVPRPNVQNAAPVRDQLRDPIQRRGLVGKHPSHRVRLIVVRRVGSREHRLRSIALRAPARVVRSRGGYGERTWYNQVAMAVPSEKAKPLAHASGPCVDVTPGDPADLFLDLLKKCLTRYVFEDGALDQNSGQLLPFDRELRADGRDWPAHAETMIGLRRLDNIQYCVTEVLRDGVPGDLVETGAWRGGAVIFMRGILKAHGDRRRLVWVADSFAGLPKPDVERFPADEGDRHWTFPQLTVSRNEVEANFVRYGLLDDQVRFLPGWFRDTLPTAPIEQIAVLRLDGDMYESTMVALDSLYLKLSPGGFVIVDDYNCVPQCKLAVDDFRATHGIVDPLQPIDWAAVYWRRTGTR